MTLSNKVQQFNDNVDLMRQIVQGDKNTVVETMGGPVPSFAKRLADFLTPIGAALIGHGNRSLKDKLDERPSAKDAPFNARGDGVTDDTAALIAGITAGGDFYVPEGNYFLEPKGDDAGGVEVTITKSVNVLCHPRARFFTNGLDNDLFRLSVPTNGIGLPADGITVGWIGGIIDQRGQKNSTVMPFMSEYPPANPGTSATCDGISIRGEYTVGGVVKSGIRQALVKDVTVIAGDHWQTAGGDSGVFMGGCKVQRVEGSTFQGCRDLGFYGSGDATGTMQVKTESIGNSFYSCMHGTAQKRSAGDFNVQGCFFFNCPRAVNWEWLVGSGGFGGDISGNTFEQCGRLIKLELVTGASVHDNHARNSGAMLADGVTAEPYAGCDGIVLLGCTGVRVKDNTSSGISAAAAALASYTNTRRFLLTDVFTPGSGPVKTSKSTLANNYCDGYRNLATDIGSDLMLWDRNFASNTTTPTLVPSGTTNYSEIRVDASGGVIFNNAVQFAEGSPAAPALCRRGQSSVGVFFASNAVGLAAGGNERVRATNIGLGFNGVTPIAKPSIAGSRGGNVALASLLTQLAAYGLILDNTTI